MTDSSSPVRLLGRASLAFALLSAVSSLSLGATVEVSAATAGFIAGGQDEPESAAELAKKIDTYLGHARGGSAVIRPQAANRLVRIGEPAAKRILEVAGKTNEQLALLGTSLIEIFGAFENSPSGDKLRQRLWPVIEDSEFPWRPAAARGLAVLPQASEMERFVRYLDDPIAPVRLSALDALFKLTEGAEGDARKAYLQHATARLSDESDFVRREAALQLHARGHGHALLWLLEDMKRSDMFFGAPFGKMARYEAMRGLMSRKIELGDYNPELPPD
ncbi:MAG: HEAT repeat protein, partial [Planctomycetota bacterium]